MLLAAGIEVQWCKTQEQGIDVNTWNHRHSECWSNHSQYPPPPIAPYQAPGNVAFVSAQSRLAHPRQTAEVIPIQYSAPLCPPPHHHSSNLRQSHPPCLLSAHTHPSQGRGGWVSTPWVSPLHRQSPTVASVTSLDPAPISCTIFFASLMHKEHVLHKPPSTFLLPPFAFHT